MKKSALICFALFLLGVVLCLIELWLRPWSDEMFGKLLLTDIAFFAFAAVAFVWSFWIRENKDSKKIHSGNGLD